MLALVLFLVGFGIKAGMWPFGQMWLPDAHPAAPSPVSSLLSGVMIKTGVYGLMRSFLWLIPAASIADYPAQTWGMILAVLGTVTLFIGTMQALKQEQSKRLLAFHSIGQVGYIILGLGACVALLPAGLANSGVMALAAVGFYGALFHTLNHGIFKSLLFLDAGSMLYATGTQDLNRMGGLMKFMPHHGRHHADRLVLDRRRSAVQRLRQQVEHLRRHDPRQPRSRLPRDLRRLRDRHQRADAGLVHEVLRRRIPLPHQQGGRGTRPPLNASWKSAGPCSCRSWLLAGPLPGARVGPDGGLLAHPADR